MTTINVRPLLALTLVIGLTAGAAPAFADQVILDDLIVDGSACIGLDCVNGESFGFDTIRIKENNLRIKAQDTSSSASFPTNDWQITFNESSNGGQNKFSIDDIDSGRTPFTIEAGADAHSLYVDTGGRIGFGTSTPVVELHVKDGDTPTLRLEQDGSSGFTAQTWDLAGNETNFFIRDVTNGSRLPLRIRPGAPTSAIDVSSDGRVGIGTASPGEELDVEKNQNGLTYIRARNNNGGTGSAAVVSAQSDLAVLNYIAHAAARVVPRFGSPIGGWSEIISIAGNGLKIGTTNNAPLILGAQGGAVLTINPGGTVTHVTAGAVHPDYVFDPEYDLKSIEEHAEQMWKARSLPAVGPGRHDEEGNAVYSIGESRHGMLEELEIAHIYIQQLNERIARLESLLEDHEGGLDSK